MEPGHLVPQGVWTLEEAKEYAKEKKICPYFAIRRMVSRDQSFLNDQVLTLTLPFTDALCRYCHLLVSLPSRSQSR